MDWSSIAQHAGMIAKQRCAAEEGRLNSLRGITALFVKPTIRS